MATVGKLAVGVVACYLALQVLPLILGASVLVGVFGLAFLSMVLGLLTTLLTAGFYIGIPLLFIVFIVSLVSDD